MLKRAALSKMMMNRRCYTMLSHLWLLIWRRRKIIVRWVLLRWKVPKLSSSWRSRPASWKSNTCIYKICKRLIISSKPRSSTLSRLSKLITLLGSNNQVISSRLKSTSFRKLVRLKNWIMVAGLLSQWGARKCRSHLVLLRNSIIGEIKALAHLVRRSLIFSQNKLVEQIGHKSLRRVKLGSRRDRRNLTSSMMIEALISQRTLCLSRVKGGASAIILRLNTILRIKSLLVTSLTGSKCLKMILIHVTIPSMTRAISNNSRNLLVVAVNAGSQNHVRQWEKCSRTIIRDRVKVVAHVLTTQRMIGLKSWIMNLRSMTHTQPKIIDKSLTTTLKGVLVEVRESHKSSCRRQMSS